MDHFIVARMGPGIERTDSLFETEANASIARLAIAQEKWLRKLNVASRLYRRGDANDVMVAARLRVLHGVRETWNLVTARRQSLKSWWHSQAYP